MEALLEPPLPLRRDVFEEVAAETVGRVAFGFLTQEGRKASRGRAAEPDMLVGVFMTGMQPWVLWAFRLYCELMQRRAEVPETDKRALWARYRAAVAELNGKRPRKRRAANADATVVGQ